jgi:hypothetical protein
MSAADDDGSALPPGWTKSYSKSQKKYYWCHLETKTSQWHPPTEEEIKNPHKAKKIAERKAREEQQQQQLEATKRKGGSHSHHSTQRKGGTSDKDINGESPTVTKKAKIGSSSSGGGGANNSSSSTSNNPSHISSSANHLLLPVDDARTSVAIIVPYRDLHKEQHRSQQLSRFLPHMTMFLSKQVAAGTVKDFHIYIVEQSDDGRKFNRGKLLNIGFDYAKRSRAHNKVITHDVFIFHDVDLLPNDDLATWYSRFPKTPIHIARCWNRYHNNPKYFGGIVSFSASDMRRINGYPNNFWGWGGEDDEMQKRCERLGIKWEYPPKGTIIDLESMTLQEKLDFLRNHREWKCMVRRHGTKLQYYIVP